MQLKEPAQIFVERGLVVIPFRWSDLVPGIIQSFGQFVALPEEEKAKWRVDIPDEEDPDKRADHGYIRTQGEQKESGGVYDRKTIFHYRPFLWQFYRIEDLPAFAKEWLAICQQLYLRCLHTIQQFATALDAALPGYSFASRSRSEYALAKNVLRLLLYDLLKSGETVIAQPHRDRNDLTIHLAESHPGLYFTDTEKQYEVFPDTALLFPGKHMEARTGGQIRALRHEVREENIAPTIQRWSIVFFGRM